MSRVYLGFMGSSGIPPANKFFPHSIGGPPVYSDPDLWRRGGGGGRVLYNQNPPLGHAMQFKREVFIYKQSLTDSTTEANQTQPLNGNNGKMFRLCKVLG